MEDFKGHGGSAVNGVLIAAGRTETAFAAKGNKLKISTVGTGTNGVGLWFFLKAGHKIEGAGRYGRRGIICPRTQGL